jgi:transcriptional regulator with GAF, ATPase, and Fis domain
MIRPGDLPEELWRKEEGRVLKLPADREELKQMKKAAQQKAKGEIEKRFIIEALRQGGGNVMRSAEMVGMDRRQFQNLLRKYGISRKDFLKDLK